MVEYVYGVFVPRLAEDGAFQNERREFPVIAGYGPYVPTHGGRRSDQDAAYLAAVE